MSHANLRKEIDIIAKALNVSKVAYGVIDSDSLIIESQKCPIRKMSITEFEREKRAQSYTRIQYLSLSWRPQQNSSSA